MQLGGRPCRVRGVGGCGCAACCSFRRKACPETRSTQRQVKCASAAPTSEWRGDVVLVCGPVKKPERALQKCVRVFRRDVGCLTDLVRCTIVAQTIQQVYAIFSSIRSVSVVHSHLKRGIGKSMHMARDGRNTVSFFARAPTSNRAFVACAG